MPVRFTLERSLHTVAGLVRSISGRAQVAKISLLPLISGHDAPAKGYAYDPAATRKPMAAAGQSAGFDTVLSTNSSDPNPRLAQSIWQDLAAIGLRTSIKSQTQSTVIEVGGPRPAGRPPERVQGDLREARPAGPVGAHPRRGSLRDAQRRLVGMVGSEADLVDPIDFLACERPSVKK